MCLLYGSGIEAFSYGAAASNFLSRGVRFASDAGSIVDCMQPPRTTPTPNKTTNNPRTDIFVLFPRCAFAAPQQKYPDAAINPKNHCEAMISSASAITFLCTCGRNAAPGSPHRQYQK